MEEFLILEMKDHPGCCRFVANWLTKAAEAQDFWSEALSDPNFADQTALLHVMAVPDLSTIALEIFGKLENFQLIAALDLYGDESGLFSIELTLLVQLGFFVYVDGSYRMVLPETVTGEKVKQAALDVLSTLEFDEFDELDVVKPELLLHTLTRTQAEERRSRLIEIRRFSDDAPYDRKIQ
jgi:hypothetical protein